MHRTSANAKVSLAGFSQALQIRPNQVSSEWVLDAIAVVSNDRSFACNRAGRLDG
jgi:hypothetical protein